MPTRLTIPSYLVAFAYAGAVWELSPTTGLLLTTIAVACCVSALWYWATTIDDKSWQEAVQKIIIGAISAGLIALLSVELFTHNYPYFTIGLGAVAGLKGKDVIIGLGDGLIQLILACVRAVHKKIIGEDLETTAIPNANKKGKEDETVNN